MSSTRPISDDERDRLDLLAEEFVKRQRRGEHPSLTEYAERFPELADEIRRAFPAIIMMEQLKPAAGDITAGLRDGDERAPEPLAAATGRLGDFRILHELGRGGMGVVYEAVQESMGRHVALKILPMNGRESPTQIERFQLEAQSAGRLNHPNIVPVFGAGVHQGVHYYAMQFIRGHGLDTIFDELVRIRNPAGRADTPEPGDGQPPAPTHSAGSSALARSLLTGSFNSPAAGVESTARPVASAIGAEATAFYGSPVPETPASAPASPGSHPAMDSALSLSDHSRYYRSMARIGFEVADALAYAHREGVLHRDIKPSNLLLDATGHIWITDFGLAKLEGSDGPTRTGDVVGTIRYMAPERFNGWSDPRSDVYSLGATLYELLTLKPLFVASGQGELVQKVLHDQPDAPQRHDPRVPRDLETIVLKAIAKEPRERYPTAEAMGEDLQRFMDDQPILARRSTASEQLWRWCRRNRRLAAVSAIAVAATLILAVGGPVAAWSFYRQRDRAIGAEGEARANLTKAQREEQKARRSESEARSVLDFFQERVVAAARPNSREGGLGREVSLREALVAAEKWIAADFADRPAVEASIRNALGTSYFYLGDVKESIPLFERARALREAALGPEHPDTIQSLTDLGDAYRNTGRRAEAIALLEEALRRGRSKLGPDHLRTLLAMDSLGLAYQKDGRFTDAISLFEEAVRREQAALGRDHKYTLSGQGNLAVAYSDAGRDADSLKLTEDTVQVMKSKLGLNHPSTRAAVVNLAANYAHAGRLADAIRLQEEMLGSFRAALGPDHPDTLATMNLLVGAYQMAGRFDDAIALGKETLSRRRVKLGDDHPDTIVSMANLGLTYRRVGRVKEAIPLAEEALKLSREKMGHDDVTTFTRMDEMASAYQAASQYDQAIALFEETLELRKAKLGADHGATFASMNNFALAYLGAGRTRDAIPLFEKALAGAKAKYGPDHPDTLFVMANLARAYQATNRLDEAIALFEEAIKLLKVKLGPEHRETLRKMNDLASAYLAADRVADGIRLHEEVLRLRRAKLDPGDPDLLVTVNNLSAAYEKTGRWADAEGLLRESLKPLETRPEAWPRFLVMSTLGEALSKQKKYAEAELLLVGGYEGLEAHASDIPAQIKVLTNRAATRIVPLYEAWGKKDNAAQWRAKLDSRTPAGKS